MSRAAASFSCFLHPVQVSYAEEETIVGGFNKGRQRQLYHMELDPDDADDQDEHQDDNWDDEHEPSGECESDWDTLVFEQLKSIPHCTTPFCKERNIAHIHSTDRCYKLHPSKDKGGSSKGSSSSLSTKGGKVAAKERIRARAEAKENLVRTRIIARARGRRAKTLVA